jgi:geranylgeranyl pyrophosphate synthase
MFAYLRREDPQLSNVLDSILTQAFSSSDPVCSTLALWASDACNGDSDVALPVAAAVESLSRFWLLHDELHDLPDRAPALDSTLARWGVAQTLNAGDACHGLALKLIASKSPYPARTLEVAVMLEEAVLRAIDARSRLIRIARSGPRPLRRRRIAYSGTRALGYEASMRAGAMIAGAPQPVVEAFARAGHRLDIAAALATSLSNAGTSRVAGRFAAAAVTEIQCAAVAPGYVREFEEIVHHLAAGD